MTGPLTSLKILDFTTLLPGPFATMMLGDLGADVLRVEAPNRPDLVRFLPPFDGDTSTWHAVLNRNKRSLGLDLKQPQAVDIVLKLVGEGGYDIVVEQFRPGVMDRLGIGYEALRAANPQIIYCAISGYGQTGPYRDRAGHDINYLALSGILSYSGRRDTGPAPLGVQIADIGGGSFGAMVGLLAAVIHRHQSGEGQFIDISMLDLMIAWQTHLLSQHLVAGETPQPEAMPLNGGRAYDVYTTKDGRYLSVGSIEPKFWAGFCEAIDRPDLFDPGLSLDPAEQARVKEEVGAAVRARPLSEWLDIFAALDVCAEPVLTVPEMLVHPQVRARELIVGVPTSTGAQQQVGSPYHLSSTSASYRHTGAALGAHSDAVLRELGYADDAIVTLRAKGVVA